MEPASQRHVHLGDSDPAEDLMARCLEAAPPEQEAELERACREHPELAAELRRRWSALEAMGLASVGADAPDLPAQLGDFRPLERLGHGGMGVVFRALQVSLGREVALKLVRPDYLVFPGARERFRREVEAVARLKHPGIVPVYAVGEERGLPYLAMELVEGCTLADVLADLAQSRPEDLSGADLARVLERRGHHAIAGAGSLFGASWQDACLRIGRELADALEHAHSRGIVHRDVKPSNIALTERGLVVLLDFGLTSSHGAERVTRTGTQPGTPHYMSPEQLRGEWVDPRTDVYSLGVVLYEMLALALPFRGSSLESIRAAVLAGRPPRIRSRNSRVTRDAEIVCAVAMDPEPSRRYASAALLARDLENVLAHRPILARPPGPLLRASRWVRRHPTASVGIALSALLVGGIPSALYVQQVAHARVLGHALASEQEARLDQQTAMREQDLALARERDANAREVRARENAEKTLMVLGNLLLDATPERSQGRPFQLEHLLERAREGLDFLKDSPGVEARYLLVLGDLYRGLGRLDEAIELLGRSLELLRTSRETPPASLLHALNSLATALQQRGRLDESAELFGEVLKAYLEQQPPEYAAIAAEHNNLSGVLMEQRDLEGAEQHVRSAIEIYERHARDELESLSTARANLAFLLCERRCLDDARIHADLALETLRSAPSIPPASRAIGLNLIAVVRRSTGDLSGAEALLRETVDTLAPIYANGDVYLAAALFNLGYALEQQGRADEALFRYEEAAAMMDALGLADHPNAAVFRRARDGVLAKLEMR